MPVSMMAMTTPAPFVPNAAQNASAFTCLMLAGGAASCKACISTSGWIAFTYGSARIFASAPRGTLMLTPLKVSKYSHRTSAFSTEAMSARKRWNAALYAATGACSDRAASCAIGASRNSTITFAVGASGSGMLWTTPSFVSTRSDVSYVSCCAERGSAMRRMGIAVILRAAKDLSGDGVAVCDASRTLNMKSHPLG